MHIHCSCSQKSLSITRVVHQSLTEVPHRYFSTYKTVFRQHWCYPCAGEFILDYLSSSLCSCLGTASTLASHTYIFIGIPSLSQHRTPWCQPPLHLNIISIRYQSPSLSLRLISPALPRSLLPSASHHYTPLILHSIFAISTHHSASLSKTHNHSPWNRAFYSYTVHAL
jgi:hypothetical protein